MPIGADRTERRRATERFVLPLRSRVARWRQNFLTTCDVVEQIQYQVVPRPRIIRERCRIARREQRGEFTLAGHEIIEMCRQQRAARVRRPPNGPRRAQLHEQPFAVRVDDRIERHVDLGQRAILAAHERFAGEKIDRTLHEVTLEARRLIARRGRGDIVLVRFVDRRCGGERRAAFPFLCDARIARLRHRAWAEIGADVDAIGVDPARPGSFLRARRSRLSRTPCRRDRTRARHRHRRRPAKALAGSADTRASRQSAPCHTQRLPSDADSASRSITVSQCGCGSR